MSQNTRVLAVSNDMFFMPQVEAAAKAAGYRFEWLETPFTEAEFTAHLAAQPTALVVLDLNTGLPWPHWLPAAKAQAATAAIPWLAFGSHLKPRRLAAARHAGATKAVPKSQFAETLQAMLYQPAQDDSDK